MRTITLPRSIYSSEYKGGAYIEVAVAVDWPELQLTDDQVFENAMARALDQPTPHKEPIIYVKVPVARP
jgi:hypothetical protein